MKLTWADDMYDMAVDSLREHHLVRDSLVEAAYAVDRLPDSDYVARFGRTKAELQQYIDEWGEFRPSRRLPVQDLELVRACFLETLDFFSDAGYEMRTGWVKEEAAQVLSAFLKDRKHITITRQWAQVPPVGLP
ncbi:hypothetical protein [Streptacidiphilus sp. PAMC 29251]